MRNSFLPLIMMLGVSAVAYLLIRPAPLPGSSGPEIYPGFFRLPRGNKLVVDSVTSVVCENDIKEATTDDQRVGCEPDSWHMVMLRAEDDGAVTRAVVLAMAEQLTASGVYVVTVPSREAPLNFAVDRVISVTSTGAQPGKLGDPISATISMNMSAPRFPAGHPAEHLQPAIGIRGGSLVIDHRNHVSEHSVVPTWGEWYATIGRSVATLALGQWAPQGTTPFDWTEQVPSDWGKWIADPPRHAVMRWHAALQCELVRGWVGEIRGKTTIAANGTEQSSFVPVEKLLKKGNWNKVSASDSPWQIWQREDGGETYLFAIRETPSGWTLTHWQERKEPAGVHEEWLDAAERGDLSARHNIRQYLLSTALPDDQQLRAAKILRSDPDAADLAMLGRVRNSEEAAIAQVIGFVRGTSDQPVNDAPGIATIEPGKPVRTRSRPILLRGPHESILVVVGSGGHGDIWARSAGEGVKHALPLDAEGKAGPIELRLSQGTVHVENGVVELR
jgi:hypothetical protein